MATQATMKDKFKDIVVIFASGVAIFFSGMSLVSLSAFIRQITLINSAIKSTPGLAEIQQEPLVAAWSCLAVSVLFVVMGILNMMYLLRYMRDNEPKSLVGGLATFGALVMTIVLMVGYVMVHNGAKVVYVPVFMETSAMSGTAMFIYYISLFLVALAAQIVNIIIMFTWKDQDSETIVDITQTTPGAIMLDKEALKREKKTARMLNADPKAPMAVGGHNVMEKSDIGSTALQTTLALQPGFNVNGQTFAEPGLEPIMKPYTQSGVYVQPDNGYTKKQ